MAIPRSKAEAMQELVSSPNRPNMTRIMELDESTRVNMLEQAVRGFPTTRGPDNLRTVCEIAALSSVDPLFIGDMLGRVPNPEDCLADWTLLAMRTDHEVMMEVLADRFRLDWQRAKVPSRWGRSDGSPWPTTTFEQALIEHDAVRMFTTAVNRGWVDPAARHRPAPYRGDWSKRPHPWLVLALGAKAPRIAEQLMTYDTVARDPQHLAEALHDLSIARHGHDGQDQAFVATWWTRLLQAGADPWLLDEHSGLPGAPTPDKATEEGATPGHRMLRHALNQLGDHRFRGEGREWLNLLHNTLIWSEAPVVNGQTLPAFALSHPKLGTRDMWGAGNDALTIAEHLIDGWARQNTSLIAMSPDANPVELLVRPYLTGARPASPADKPSWQVSMFDRDKPPEPLLFDRAMDGLKPWLDAFPNGAMGGPSAERLAQAVVNRLQLRRDWADPSRRFPSPTSEEDRAKKTAEWRDWVDLVHDRLQRLDRWIVPAARPAWQAWTQDWYATWSSWPSVPDDQVKDEGPRRTERLALSAAFLATAETPAVDLRPRNRL